MSLHFGDMSIKGVKSVTKNVTAVPILLPYTALVPRALGPTWLCSMMGSHPGKHDVF